MIFGTYFAISFFWVTPTNTLAYFSQNIIGMLFHVLLGFVFVKYFQSDKMKTILSYIFCVYFA
jgi:hypothetical protein